jgi:hypothetical protein
MPSYSPVFASVYSSTATMYTKRNLLTPRMPRPNNNSCSLKPYHQCANMERESRRILGKKNDPRTIANSTSKALEDSDSDLSPVPSTLSTPPITPIPRPKVTKLHHHHHYITRLCTRTPINKINNAPLQWAQNTIRQNKREEE